MKLYNLVKIHENQTRFEICDELIKLCLQKQPENRVSNGCLLLKNRKIKGLIYQLESGLQPSELIFSQKTSDVVSRVNIKLLEEIAQFKIEIKEKNEEIAREKNKRLQVFKIPNIISPACKLNGLGKFLLVENNLTERFLFR